MKAIRDIKCEQRIKYNKDNYTTVMLGTAYLNNDDGSKWNTKGKFAIRHKQSKVIDGELLKITCKHCKGIAVVKRADITISPVREFYMLKVYVVCSECNKRTILNIPILKNALLLQGKGH